MAHGQSDQFRRAGWLVAACGLAAAVGCTSPDKNDAKGLDPATKQKLIGLGPQPAATKPGTGTAALDQRFDRTVPTKLPPPQLASTNLSPAPNPNPTGSFGPPTKPVNPPTFGGPQTGGDTFRPQMPAEPVIRTGAVAPVMPPPLGPTGLPEPSGAIQTPGVLTAAPLGGNLIPPDPPAPLPSAFPLAPPPPPATPLPGENREMKLPEVPTFPVELPPIRN